MMMEAINSKRKLFTVSGKAVILKIAFLLIICSLLVKSNLIAQSNKKFVVGTIEAEAGEKTSGKLLVEKGTDKGTFIPITIINGSKSGPVLTLIAGIHGTEYVPIITLQNLINKIDPKKLSGTIIMVHVANIPSFSKRTAYFSPVDNKNLNRVFPGKKDGTQTERIAFIITQKIIDQSDYLIDLHGGEFNVSIINFALYSYDCPDETIGRKSMILAKNFGLNYILPSPFNIVPDSIEYTYCDLTALRRGVAAILVEIGDRGKVELDIVNSAVRGIYNVLRSLEMIAGEIIINKHPIYLKDDIMIASKSSGIFYPLAVCGQTVSKGALIGYTTNYFGNLVEEYHSPFTCIIIMNYSAPTVNKGENVFWIAKVVDQME